jgi:hypothetical protein
MTFSLDLYILEVACCLEKEEYVLPPDLGRN